MRVPPPSRRQRPNYNRRPPGWYHRQCDRATFDVICGTGQLRPSSSSRYGDLRSRRSPGRPCRWSPPCPRRSRWTNRARSTRCGQVLDVQAGPVPFPHYHGVGLDIAAAKMPLAEPGRTSILTGMTSGLRGVARRSRGTRRHMRRLGAPSGSNGCRWGRVRQHGLADPGAGRGDGQHRGLADREGHVERAVSRCPGRSPTISVSARASWRLEMPLV
jgi:hypothetical protein